MPKEFNYNDCQKSIQSDLITMLNNYLTPFGHGQKDITQISNAACRIVVDNFNKINFKQTMNEADNI